MDQLTEEKLLDVDQVVDMVRHLDVEKKDKKQEVVEEYIYGLKVDKHLYIKDFQDVDLAMLDLLENMQ